MALRGKWQFMDRSVTHKIVYGPQLRFGPYTILWVTSWYINCHMALSAMNYLINIYVVVYIFILQSVHLLYKYAIRIHFCFIRSRRINFSFYTNKLFSLRINFPGTLQLCTAEGADKYENGTNVTLTTKKTPLTTFMKGEEWRLFLSFLFISDKFSDIFYIAG